MQTIETCWKRIGTDFDKIISVQLTWWVFQNWILGVHLNEENNAEIFH